ncbi:fused signal recognition particle receptor [Halohasta litchfieldiae]|uniref:Signal recognition particle receptor FtsY n=1 Tax=Halohasta litchfieldiae TaxID=1073996 RepID=A0A1H6VJW3_9EURY|nr:signal recognition particle-docking protein FtsY [Halohasta litchfieldiae]ATW88945.1 fused signal recognition particle receptor [Halohasta litchfieldiae]SEJ01050.1 signal recognition particle-docking protein FtsY [Halohasta litchfieldiae]
MFDGLKDKLSKFRNDVEETAEEKAEAEDVEETDSEAAASDSEAAASNAESASPDTQSTPEQESPTDTSSTDGTATAETTEQVDTTDSGASDSTESTETAEETDDEDESSGPGRLKRAAAFATGKIIIEEEDLEDPLWELEMALLESDVEMSVAEEILETVREKMIGETRKQVDTTAELVELALHDALVDVISVGQFDFEKRLAEADKPVTIVFTGVNGVGKTTSIAKLSEYLADRGYSSVLANGDTYRAGANEQLQKHADNLDRKLISHEQGGDPAAVIYDGVEYAEAHDIDVVLGDTAGRLHTSDDLMSQLAKIHRVVDPDLTLFVDEAVAGQDAVMRAQEFDDAATVDGTVLTKADADSSGGAAISISYVTGKPILFLGTGQGYDDIEPFVPEELVDQLLGEE